MAFWDNVFKFKKRSSNLQLNTNDIPPKWREFFNSTKSKVAVNEKSVLGISTFFRAVNIVSEQMASMPLDVFKDDGKNVVEVKPNPLKRAFSGGIMNNFIFRETMIKTVMLKGNCFIRCFFSSSGEILSFDLIRHKTNPIIVTVDGVYYYSFGEGQTYRADEILHIRSYSTDGIFGLNPIEIFTEVHGISIALIEYLASYFGNGAFLSGYLETDKYLNTTQEDEILKSWADSYAGPTKTGKTALLHSGLKYKPRGTSPSENSSLDLKSDLAIDVSNMTGVPLPLLSYLDKANFNSIEELNKLFVQYTLRGWAKRIEEEIDQKLYLSKNLPFEARHKIDSLNRSDLATRSDYYLKGIQNGWLNPDEVRALEYMPARADGKGGVYGHPLLQYKNQKV